MKLLGESAASARIGRHHVTIAIILVVATSFFITRILLNPRYFDGQDQRNFQRVFEADLNITSPPEISELAGAFNSMVVS